MKNHTTKLTALVAVIAVIGLFAASAVAGPTTTASLKAAHQGASNPGFQAEEDDRCPEGAWGWHFVMPTSGTDFVSLDATFTTAGVVAASDFYSAGSQVKHAYVFTPGPDTLVNATAQVTGPGTEFNLSHVCTGSDTPTTTTTAPPVTTTTAPPVTTTTVPPVTTTTAPPPTTTTTSPLVTVPGSPPVGYSTPAEPTITIIPARPVQAQPSFTG